MKIPDKISYNTVSYVHIDVAHNGQRLDNFLISNLKGVPKSHIYQVLRTGQVRVNKGRRQPHYRVQTGDILRIPPIRLAKKALPALNIQATWLETAILHEDNDLLVINKPSGLAVHGGSGVSLGLIEHLRRLRPKARFLELAHRLDRETSGCLLVAKRRPVLLALHRQLRHSEMNKHYTALVKGTWGKKNRYIEAALSKNRLKSGERVVKVSAGGKSSSSRFIPVSVRQAPVPVSLVEIELLTGRTHQARVHAAHIGHPIAGDSKYGEHTFNNRMRDMGLKRLFLHASSIGFVHPAMDRKMLFTAPLPMELTALLDKLAHETKL